MKILHIPTLASEMGWFALYSTWRDLCHSLFYLKQREELEDLIQWATRKRLKKIRSYYIELLLNNSSKIMRYQIHSPQVLFWAEWLHCARKMIFPEDQYYRKGSAGKYKA